MSFHEQGMKMLKKDIQFWIDDHAHCEECGYVYQSIEDFLRCDPYKGHTEKLSFVCGSCYHTYCMKHPLMNGRYYRGKTN